MARCALFVINPDGSGLERLLAPEAFHGINTVTPSPDGTKLLWVEWDTGNEGRLHLFDLTSRTDQRLPTGTFPGIFSMNRAWFSPDGQSILFDLFEADGDHWAVIPATGGEIRRLGPEWPADTPDAAWSPDGRSVLSRYPAAGGTSELWLLDATGSGQDRRLPVDVPDLPTWQRLAP
jgi:Tol biopolymer transport system component